MQRKVIRGYISSKGGIYHIYPHISNANHFEYIVSFPTAEDIEYLVQASKKPMFQMHVPEEDDPLTDEEDILSKYERERTLARRRRAVMLRSKLEKKKNEAKVMKMKTQKKEELADQPVNEGKCGNLLLQLSNAKNGKGGWG